MKPVAVKICGLTRCEDADHAIRCGAAAAGLIFYEKSPRHVTLDRAHAIATVVGERALTIGVFVNASRDAILEAIETVPLGAIQLHGDEPPEALSGWPVPVIKAFRVGADFSPDRVEAYREASAHLFDTRLEGTWGGTGESFAWEQLTSVKTERLILAGGIGPENVDEAVRAVRPAAVDCSSRLEVEPGKKDPDRIETLFLALERAEILTTTRFPV